jgi:hypothetical protein
VLFPRQRVSLCAGTECCRQNRSPVNNIHRGKRASPSSPKQKSTLTGRSKADSSRANTVGNRLPLLIDVLTAGLLGYWDADDPSVFQQDLCHGWHPFAARNWFVGDTQGRADARRWTGFETTPAHPGQRKRQRHTLAHYRDDGARMQGDRERCIAAAMDSYISEPLNIGQLIELVEKFADATQQEANRA